MHFYAPPPQTPPLLPGALVSPVLPSLLYLPPWNKASLFICVFASNKTAAHINTQDRNRELLVFSFSGWALRPSSPVLFCLFSCRCALQRSTTLSKKQRDWIASSDTFMLGTYAGGQHGGADASNRGGNPGFVRALDDRTIVFPDYKVWECCFRSFAGATPVLGLEAILYSSAALRQSFSPGGIDQPTEDYSHS